MDRRHHYNLSFVESIDTQFSYVSIIILNTKKCVTINDILNAKESAGVSSNAVMLSCSYLGHMTIEEASGV